MLKKKKIGIFTVEKKEANSTTKEDLDETVCYTDESDGDSDATFFMTVLCLIMKMTDSSS